MRSDAKASSILRNALASLIGRKLGLILRAIATLQVAGYLGETGWGLFGFLLSIFEVFRVLTSLGLDTAALRSVAIHPRQQAGIIRVVCRAKTGFVVVAFLSLTVFASLIPSWAAHRGLLLLLAVSLFPQAYVATLTVRFQAAHAMERLIPVQVAAGVLYLGLVQLLVRGRTDLAGFLALGVAIDYVTLGLTWAAAHWRRRESTASPSGGSVKREGERGPAERGELIRLVLAGLPLGLVELMVIVYSRLGIFYLQRFGGITAVGDYFAAYKVAEPLVIVGGALAVSALPVLSRLAGEGQLQRLRTMFLRYSLGSALLSSGLAIVVSLLATQTLRLIKPEFAPGAGALAALVWAAAFMLQNQLSSTVLYAFGKFHWVAGCAAINLAVYVVLGFTLVRGLGSTGAGLATLGTEGLNAVIQLLLVFRVVRGDAGNRPSPSYA